MMGIRTITFEDHGQDFLKWDIDEKGNVIDCRPFQAWIWCNKIVTNHTQLKVGGYVKNKDIRTNEIGEIRYPIIAITEALGKGVELKSCGGSMSKIKEFQFGDVFINPYASDNNPRKKGYFVKRIIRKKGMINPGLHYEFTDKKGDFWLISEEVLKKEVTNE
jgi:hypothetical protein